MRYLDTILGSLRSGGLSIEDAAHAFWLLDAYVYGQVVQEGNLSPAAPGETADPASTSLPELAGGEYAHLAEVAARAVESPFSVDGEFGFGLDLILDASERTTASSLDPALAG